MPVLLALLRSCWFLLHVNVLEAQGSSPSCSESGLWNHGKQIQASQEWAGTTHISVKSTGLYRILLMVHLVTPVFPVIQTFWKRFIFFVISYTTRRGPPCMLTFPLTPLSTTALWNILLFHTELFYCYFCTSASPRGPVPWDQMRFKQPLVLICFLCSGLTSSHSNPHTSSEYRSLCGFCFMSTIKHQTVKQCVLILRGPSL